VRVKYLAQEHNTMSPVRARTQTGQSGDKCTKHEATVPPLSTMYLCLFVCKRPFTCMTPISELLFNAKKFYSRNTLYMHFIFEHKHAACIPNIAESAIGTVVLLYLRETYTDASIPYCCISEAVMENIHE